MIDLLLQKIDDSDQDGAAALLGSDLVQPGKAWAVHLSLFPVVQRVANPPFINPHLPKMYGILRDFLPYLAVDDLPALVRLEINEYARRTKLKVLTPPATVRRAVSFADVEAAFREANRQKAAVLLQAFLDQKGKEELARNLLLLGSGYLADSLGHAVSCTGFILLEMMEQPDQDPWPTLTALAEYFCRGRFHTRSELRKAEDLRAGETLAPYLLLATSGTGFLNLHHTITLYAIERVRHLLSDAEYGHLLACWLDLLGDKTVEALPAVPAARAVTGYEDFYRRFSGQAEEEVLACLAGMISSEAGRQQAGCYLIKAVCDSYQGEYDPHFLTGLGAALWVMEHSRDQASLAMSALRQYVNFFFSRISG